MPLRMHIARCLARRVRRWFPGPDDVAGAAAATGDPSPLLGLEADHDPHPDPDGTR